MIKKFLKKEKNILILLLALDILMIVLHLLWGSKTVFHLDKESNLPTIYQGSKLIFLSLLSFLMVSLIYLKKRKIKKDWFWVFWGSMFFFLGIDEIGQIHENIAKYMREIFGDTARTYEATFADAGYSSTNWLVYYAIFFVISTAIVIWAIKKFYKENSKTVWLLIIGWIMFLGVIIVEYVNTMPHIMFKQGYGELMILEESLEMFGASFLFTFTYSKLKELIKFS